MTPDVLLTSFGTLALSILLTGLVRKLALSHGVIDVPNQRSSHTVPTPRGGGAAIVISVSAAACLLVALGKLDVDLLVALTGGGLAVALVGFVDDRRSLSAAVRLTVHFLAALWALAWLGGIAPLRLGDHVIHFGWSGYVFGTFAIVWVLNLFNFMDGTDGIAASESVFITWGAAFVALVVGTSHDQSALAIVLGAACLGFLAWNWPPARIFLGDIGSGYIGYSVAVLALASARENAVGPLVWLMLGGTFFVDATVTLLRRLARFEQLFVAHRTHAYQRLARRWTSHRRVALVVTLINFVWLLPCALVATAYPRMAGWLLLLATTPLVLLALVAGAGSRD